MTIAIAMMGLRRIRAVSLGTMMVTGYRVCSFAGNAETQSGPRSDSDAGFIDDPQLFAELADTQCRDEPRGDSKDVRLILASQPENDESSVGLRCVSSDIRESTVERDQD